VHAQDVLVPTPPTGQGPKALHIYLCPVWVLFPRPHPHNRPPTKAHAGRRPELYFWRNHIGNEVDLLYERGGRRIVVEIKAGVTLGTDQFKGLKYYRKLAATSPIEQGYFLVYGGEENQQRVDGRVLGWRAVEALP